MSSFRGLIEVYYSENGPSDRSVERGYAAAVDALARIEDALSGCSGPNAARLLVLVDGFCQEVDSVAMERERKSAGGQQVPLHSMLANVGPSALSELKRYVREFRAAMGVRL